MAIIYPSLDRIRNLVPAPENGELAILNYLAENLDDSFEIFFQPMLDGDRPDVAILKRNVGVALIEVKDWNLSHYRLIDNSTWQVRKNSAIIRSPVLQVEKYKDHIYSLYIPELCAQTALENRLYGIVSTSVYFHEASSGDIDAFFTDNFPKYTKLLGRDLLNPAAFSFVIQSLSLTRSSNIFSDALYERVRRLLAPSTHIAEQGIPLPYTIEQQKLIPSRPEEKKISGVAGSGKTYILAKRAVNALARTDSPVLILTFNITLRNYIHDRISEVRQAFEWSSLYITNYHCFFSVQANRYELPWSLDSSFEDECFFERAADRIQRYSSIFVDEVQDYRIEWLRIIKRYFAAPGCEYVLFGDEKQNVYGRPLEERGIRTNILGRFVKLKSSQRLNVQTAEIATKFQAEFFRPHFEIDLVESVRQGSLFEPHTEYLQMSGATPEQLVETITAFVEKWRVHPNDIAILCSRTEQVRFIDAAIRARFHHKTTICTETQEEFDEIRRRQLPDCGALAIRKIRRSRRYHFWANAGTIKISTIHCFKGWEASALFVLVESSCFEDRISDELIYTALTRCRDHLVVINLGNERYDSFFQREIGATKWMADPQD